MAPVKVLEVLGRSAGGIARHVADLAEGLPASDLLIETAGPPDLPIDIPGVFHALTIPDGPIFGHGSAIKKLTKLLDGKHLVHAHGLRAGIDAASAARKHRIPSVVTVHNLVRPEIAGRLKAPLYRYAERLVVRMNDRVFCVSQQIAHHLQDLEPAHAAKIEVTYLGVSDLPAPRRTSAEVRSELGIPQGGKLVATVARLAPQKALHVMFEAIEQLPGATLVVLGEGPSRSVLERQASQIAPGKVLFLGFRPDVADIVRASDAFCLSSIWEGVPLAAMEAILCGTVVVSTDVGGMSELVSQGRSGLLVEKNDPEALAEALRTVLDDPELAGRFSSEAKASLTERFNRIKMLERIERAYRELADA